MHLLQQKSWMERKAEYISTCNICIRNVWRIELNIRTTTTTKIPPQKFRKSKNTLLLSKSQTTHTEKQS